MSLCLWLFLRRHIELNIQIGICVNHMSMTNGFLNFANSLWCTNDK